MCRCLKDSIKCSDEILQHKNEKGSDLLLKPNVVTLKAKDATGNIDGWFEHYFARPTLIEPLAPLDGVVLVHPYKPPTDALDQLRLKSNDGAIWIPFAGTWFLRYDVNGATPVECRTLDGSGDGLEPPKTQRADTIVPASADSVVTVTTVGVDVVAADMDSDGVTFVNHDTTNPVYVKLGTKALNPAVLNEGYVIWPGETLPLTKYGVFPFKGAVNMISKTASVNVGVQRIYS